MAKFSFGKNWQDFIKSLDDNRFKNAQKSLTEFLGLDDLKGKTFIDVGCGSGLFSDAAYKLGAEKVVSFDLDKFSVECTRYLHTKAGQPKNWEVYEGSVLDKNFLSKFGVFDIVYAWGSLHHTGNMQEAIINSARLTGTGGFFMLAIYNKVLTRYGSSFWLKLKKFYNDSPFFIKRALESAYMTKTMAYYIANGKNPLKILKDFKIKRGMSWRHDVVDWLGGYPYEFATVEEIFQLMKKYFPDFKLINIKTTNGLGNNQFLFKRS